MLKPYFYSGGELRAFWAKLQKGFCGQNKKTGPIAEKLVRWYLFFLNMFSTFGFFFVLSTDKNLDSGRVRSRSSSRSSQTDALYRLFCLGP